MSEINKDIRDLEAEMVRKESEAKQYISSITRNINCLATLSKEFYPSCINHLENALTVSEEIANVLKKRIRKHYKELMQIQLDKMD